jgi:hypothetical protein
MSQSTQQQQHHIAPNAMQVVNVMGEDDIIQDWDIANRLWTHAL